MTPSPQSLAKSASRTHTMSSDALVTAPTRKRGAIYVLKDFTGKRNVPN